MMCKSDPVDLFMGGYNHRRLHMSLGVDGESETPTHAFIRKMPSRGETIVDKQTGENAMSSEGGTTFHIPQVQMH